jgi:hypothetical protein
MQKKTTRKPSVRRTASLIDQFQTLLMPRQKCNTRVNYLEQIQWITMITILATKISESF